MKPKQAKELTKPYEVPKHKYDETLHKWVDDPDNKELSYHGNPINQALDDCGYAFNKKSGEHYWRLLQIVINGIEKAGYKVSITKE